MPPTPPASPSPRPSRARAPRSASSGVAKRARGAPFGVRGGDGVERLTRTEWLLTNGLSGFAMGTPGGVPSRRYHGVLVSDTAASPMRRVYVNALSEEVILTSKEGMRVVPLSTFRFRAGGTAGERTAGGGEDVLHPDGLSRLVSFETRGESGVCRWEYNLEGTVVVKRLALRRDTRAAAVGYEVTPAKGVKAELRVRPLMSLRNYHWTQRRDEGGGGARQFEATPSANGCEVRRVGEEARVHLSCSPGVFEAQEQWWYNFVYSVDRARGQECVEDLFSPGEFRFVAAGRKASFQATLQVATEPGVPIVGIDEIEKSAAARRGRFVAAVAVGGEPAANLAWAADDFVFTRGTGKEGDVVSVIAGYPWFTDWGRDAMISLPGLLLATGRHDEARRVLTRFADARRNGIVPNRFGDDEGEPLYNTVDASLWFIVACWRYLQATGDVAGFQRSLMPACLDIVEHYRRGTDFAIAMDPEDFLIAAGSPMTPLTWMDAARDGVVFTARHGKAVEINALWCSGLAMLAEAGGASEAIRSADLRSLADSAASSFRARFWNDAARCCYDTVTPIDGKRTPVAEIRPNQIFAASLPYSPLNPTQRRDVVACVRERLYTPMGLRTLDPADPGYRARFRGNLFELDAAYHNGTAWPWLLGAFAEAVMRVGEFSEESRADAQALLEPIVGYMDKWCLGQLPEVFDAEGTPEDPQQPGGCPAQAWSVAEVLRAWVMAGTGEG